MFTPENPPNEYCHHPPPYHQNIHHLHHPALSTLPYPTDYESLFPPTAFVDPADIFCSIMDQNHQLDNSSLEQQRLQYEMAQIGLGTPPTSPLGCAFLGQHFCDHSSPASQVQLIQHPGPPRSLLSTACSAVDSTPSNLLAITSTPSTFADLSGSSSNVIMHPHPFPQQIQNQSQQQHLQPTPTMSSASPSSSSSIFAVESPFVDTVSVIGSGIPDDFDLFPMAPIASSLPSSSSSSMYQSTEPLLQQQQQQQQYNFHSTMSSPIDPSALVDLLPVEVHSTFYAHAALQTLSEHQEQQQQQQLGHQQQHQLSQVFSMHDDQGNAALHSAPSLGHSFHLNSNSLQQSHGQSGSLFEPVGTMPVTAATTMATTSAAVPPRERIARPRSMIVTSLSMPLESLSIYHHHQPTGLPTTHTTNSLITPALFQSAPSPLHATLSSFSLGPASRSSPTLGTTPAPTSLGLQASPHSAFSSPSSPVMAMTATPSSSSSVPNSPMVAVNHLARHDRRRSSSGCYSYLSSSSPSLSTYHSHQGTSSHHSYHRAPQPIQPYPQPLSPSSSTSAYSPSSHPPHRQFFHHLLEPDQVPEITDIHVCPVCQRRFTRPFNLRSHIMTHTTARPFPCDQCHWKFTRQHDLLRHKRAKHPGSVPSLSPGQQAQSENSTGEEVAGESSLKNNSQEFNLDDMEGES